MTSVSRIRSVLITVAVSAAACAAAVLYWFDPARHNFYPVCLFHLLTGLACPGCGATRALHQLLHGNIAAAARLNLLVIACLPPLTWLAARYAVARLRGRPAHLPVPSSWLWTFAALSAVFTVVRNLPGFDWLAP
jgi:hypothetical protein